MNIQFTIAMTFDQKINDESSTIVKIIRNDDDKK